MVKIVPIGILNNGGVVFSREVLFLGKRTQVFDVGLALIESVNPRLWSNIGIEVECSRTSGKYWSTVGDFLNSYKGCDDTFCFIYNPTTDQWFSGTELPLYRVRMADLLQQKVDFIKNCKRLTS